jgi:hypothetical protein
MQEPQNQAGATDAPNQSNQADTPGQPRGATHEPLYVRMKVKPRTPPLKTACGFRLIQLFTVDHNVARLRRHMERQRRHGAHLASTKRLAMKLRRTRSVKP